MATPGKWLVVGTLLGNSEQSSPSATQLPSIAIDIISWGDGIRTALHYGDSSSPALECVKAVIIIINMLQLFLWIILHFYLLLQPLCPKQITVKIVFISHKLFWINILSKTETLLNKSSYRIDLLKTASLLKKIWYRKNLTTILWRYRCILPFNLLLVIRQNGS